MWQTCAAVWSAVLPQRFGKVIIVYNIIFRQKDALCAFRGRMKLSNISQCEVEFAFFRWLIAFKGPLSVFSKFIIVPCRWCLLVLTWSREIRMLTCHCVIAFLMVRCGTTQIPGSLDWFTIHIIFSLIYFWCTELVTHFVSN